MDKTSIVDKTSIQIAIEIAEEIFPECKFSSSAENPNKDVFIRAVSLIFSAIMAEREKHQNGLNYPYQMPYFPYPYHPCITWTPLVAFSKTW